MNILQALFFPPEQPGGVSSMVPYVRERFRKIGWEMELFSLPKRIRNKGQGDVAFDTFDWRLYAGHETVDNAMKYRLVFLHTGGGGGNGSPTRI